MTSTVTPGVALVMHVPRQESALLRAVEGYLAVLEESGRPHSIVLVGRAGGPAAGGSDAVLARYADRVDVVHTTTTDAAAATRAGLRAALERTDHADVLLAVGEGVLPPEDVAGFLAEASTGRADVVLAQRSRPRGGHGRLPARRSAAGGALVSRWVMDGAAGDDEDVQATIVARARERGARVVRRDLASACPEASVTTPAAGRVLHVGSGRPRRRWRDVVAWRPRDRPRALLAVGSAVASVVAVLHYLAANAVLAYPDAVSHLLIARRVLDSPTPGVTQLGAVWLPLPPILTLPVVDVDALYRSGLAGALVSMTAYVLATRYFYDLVLEITGRREAGVVAALVFALCPNVLYLQSTPMTELPFLCALVGATYHLTRWSRTARHAHLAAAAALALLATLTRYESWVFVLAMTGVVVVTAWRRTTGDSVRSRLRHVEAHTVYFGLLAFAGIAGWLVWNAVIFGDVTFFYDGAYAEVALLPEDIADGSWPITLQTYWYAVVDNIGVPLAVAGLVGLAGYLVRTRLRGPFLAAATPVVLLPFFLWFLWSGSRPLRVMELNGSLYNVRYGLVMVVPVAVLVGFLVAELCRLLRERHGWIVASAATVAVLAAALTTAAGGTATLQEAIGFRATPQEQANTRAAAWLAGAYRGGTVLMDTPGNETVVGDSHLPTQEILYDGNDKLWTAALASPARAGVTWIYMRGNRGGGGSVGGLADEPDRVWADLADTSELDGYALVYDADDRRVYHRIGAP